MVSLSENVLKQAGGQRTEAFELLQVNKVSVQDHLLVQNLGPVRRETVRLRHDEDLRESEKPQRNLWYV